MRSILSLPLNLGLAFTVAVITSPAFAVGWPPGVIDGGGGGSVSTPAPIAGAGLVAIGIAGVVLYRAIRRARKPD